MIGMRQKLGEQFGRPRGIPGRVVARMMRHGNAPLNLWLVALLHIEPDSRVLEVGFGPGVAFQKLVDRTPKGFVAGVDISPMMVRQARSRHADAVRTGRIDLRKGDAGSLPYGDETFDLVCGTHVIYFWPDAGATVRELRRVLRTGGTLALGYQEEARMPGPSAAALTRAGARLFAPGEVEQVVRDAGFENVRLETRDTPDGPGGFCVLAVK